MVKKRLPKAQAILCDEVLGDIATERDRQAAMGFTPEHDDQHADGSLAICGGCIANGITTYAHVIPDWVSERTSRVLHKYPRRQQLIIAAALIVAEIERLDRAGS